MWIIWGMYLLVIAIGDIKYRKISAAMVLLGGVITGVTVVLEYQGLFVHAVGMLMGGVFLLVSKWSKEAIGWGDSIVMLLVGIAWGVEGFMVCMMIAFLLCATYGGLQVIRKKADKKTTVPLFPFLLLGYFGMLLI